MLALAENSAADVVVVEVGGTVGDIEGLPFLEAIRQMRNQVGRDNVFYIHVTLLPHISTTGELKTKPTQHSVKELRSIGIQPDALVCRSDFSITEETREKLSTFCDVQKEAVIALPTVPSIYEVPLLLEDAGLGELLVRHLDLSQSEPGLVTWRSMVDRLKEPKEVIPIAVVGKYAELPDSYLSVKEALHHAALFHNLAVEISWVSAEAIEEDGVEAHLDSVQGIVVPGGFGPRGINGMRQAVRYAQDRNVPYFGLCLGMQVMVVEFASLALGSPNANSTEFDPDTTDPVIDLMSDQYAVTDMGGTMRLGVYPCDLVQGSLAARAYNADNVWERHRHRFEFNNRYRESLEEAGLLASGLSPDGKLVEITELRGHPFMIGVQFHPEFLSRPNSPHPLFRDFIGAAKGTIREGGQHLLPMNGATRDR
jgi:CTP synthase